MLPPKTIWERVIHAVLFETLATAICAPLFAWIMNKTLFEMGLLTIMFAFVAMIWNMLYNAIFEFIEHAMHWYRTVKIRILHACGFECTLIIVIVPLAAWWLDVSFITAFMMEIGLFLFFLPYTYVFNLIYDTLRMRRLEKRKLCPN